MEITEFLQEHWVSVFVASYLMGMMLYGHYRGFLRLSVSLAAVVLSFFVVRAAAPQAGVFVKENTGLHPNGWQIKNMKTRWGTCNVNTRKIWLNLQLAKKTPECLEYVIVHELMHLIERSHNEKFVALMDQYLPNWREIRKKLNTQILDHMD